MTDETGMVDAGQNTATDDSYEESEELNNDELDGQDENLGSDGEGEDEVEYTEKGTRKDPDPKSAVHQELANTRRQLQQAVGILQNPTLLKRYAEQNGMTLAEARADIKETKEDAEDTIEEFTADQFKTPADVAKALNGIRQSTTKTIKELQAENKRLREGYSGINSSREAERIVNNMDRDITAVRSKYSVLNPKSPDFDKELEEEIGSLYHDLDFDPKTQRFMGRVSVLTIADRVMKAAGRARKRGSREAQTDVRVKQAGKVTSGKGKSKGGSTEGLTIAQKIAKAYGNG